MIKSRYKGGPAYLVHYPVWVFISPNKLDFHLLTYPKKLDEQEQVFDYPKLRQFTPDLKHWPVRPTVSKIYRSFCWKKWEFLPEGSPIPRPYAPPFNPDDYQNLGRMDSRLMRPDPKLFRGFGER